MSTQEERTVKDILKEPLGKSVHGDWLSMGAYECYAWLDVSPLARLEEFVELGKSKKKFSREDLPESIKARLLEYEAEMLAGGVGVVDVEAFVDGWFCAISDSGHHEIRRRMST